MKQNQAKEFLLKELADRFIRFFLDEGFIVNPLSKKERCPELNQAFPLGRMKRELNGDLQIVELQFDKNGGAKFVLNFGVVPSEGVVLPWGDFLSRDEADTSALKESYRLYQNSYCKKWFSYGLFSKKTKSDASRVVDSLIKYSSEILDWFESRKVGPHLRRN